GDADGEAQRQEGERRRVLQRHLGREIPRAPDDDEVPGQRRIEAVAGPGGGGGVHAAGGPYPPPPGVSITKASPASISTWPMWSSSSTRPSARSTRLRPTAPA